MNYRMIATITLVLNFLCSVGTWVEAQNIKTPKCLFIASYHRGYEWQDGEERGVRSVLKGKCEIKQFNMDTKRNTSPEFGKAKAIEAMELIESWKPDIIIAIDDNASKYLVAPYLRNAEIPVVFAGVNWTAKEYGYPYVNATGMIETAPIRPLIFTLKKILPRAKKGICLSSSHLSSQKSADRLKQYAESTGIEVTIIPADTMNDFEKHYVEAQEADFIVLLNNASINDWDTNRAKKITSHYSKKLTVTTEELMTPFTILGITNVSEEQGEYAAEIALLILSGTRPQDIQVVANRRWHTYINMALLNSSNIRIPANILNQAIRVE